MVIINIRSILYNFKPNQSRIENLPFPKPNSAIFFKTKIRVLVGKEKVDLYLQEFAEYSNRFLTLL